MILFAYKGSFCTQNEGKGTNVVEESGVLQKISSQSTNLLSDRPFGLETYSFFNLLSRSNEHLFMNGTRKWVNIEECNLNDLQQKNGKEEKIAL